MRLLVKCLRNSLIFLELYVVDVVYIKFGTASFGTHENGRKERGRERERKGRERGERQTERNRFLVPAVERMAHFVARCTEMKTWRWV